MSEPISIHIWSDVVCPWCYIGKRRLETALAKFDGDVNLEYHSFELSPDTPESYSGTVKDYLAERKNIAPEQVEQMLARTTDLATHEGLHFDYANAQQTKTLLAHQAAHFAKANGKQLEMIERLFKAYFEEGAHVGRIDELVALGEDVGLDADGLRTALEAGTYAEAVNADLEVARDINITGVPFYVVDNKYGISGAQDPEMFLSVLRDVQKEHGGLQMVGKDDAACVDDSCAIPNSEN